METIATLYRNAVIEDNTEKIEEYRVKYLEIIRSLPDEPR